MGRLFGTPAAVDPAQVRLDEAEAVLDQIYEAARAGLCASARRQAGLSRLDTPVAASAIAAQDALLDVTNAVKAYRGVA